MWTWFDGHMVLALVTIPPFSIWLIGYINWRRAGRP